MSHLVQARITASETDFYALLSDLQASRLITAAEEVADLRAGFGDDSSSAGLSEASDARPRYLEIEFIDEASQEDIEDIAVRAPRIHDVAFELLDQPDATEADLPEVGYRSRS